MSNHNFVPKFDNVNRPRRITYHTCVRFSHKIQCFDSCHQIHHSTSIMNSSITSKSSSFRNWRRFGLIVKLAHFLENKNQHACDEVNESRLITSTRWATESVSCLIK